MITHINIRNNDNVVFNATFNREVTHNVDGWLFRIIKEVTLTDSDQMILDGFNDLAKLKSIQYIIKHSESNVYVVDVNNV